MTYENLDKRLEQTEVEYLAASDFLNEYVEISVSS